jgi:hypothetical protein
LQQEILRGETIMYRQRLATVAFAVTLLFSVLTAAHEALGQAGSGVIASPRNSGSAQPRPAPSEENIAGDKSMESKPAPFEVLIKSKTQPPESEPLKETIEVKATGKSNSEPSKSPMEIKLKAN